MIFELDEIIKWYDDRGFLIDPAMELKVRTAWIELYNQMQAFTDWIYELNDFPKLFVLDKHLMTVTPNVLVGECAYEIFLTYLDGQVDWYVTNDTQSVINLIDTFRKAFVI